MDLVGLQFLSKVTWRGYSNMQIVALLVSSSPIFILIGSHRCSHCCPSILSMFIAYSLQASWFRLNSWMICEFVQFPFFSHNIIEIAITLLYICTNKTQNRANRGGNRVLLHNFLHFGNFFMTYEMICLRSSILRFL